MQGVEPGYRAFISYSHGDEAFARRIHRGLESYRLPRRLAADGAPQRLTPIFRDRDELPAAGDLSQTIKDALARSEALIVLCSPAAQGSRWVAREVELFRELHPDRPILAALISGEPMDAFPAALLRGVGTEPIAADFRKAGDGARLARLKLIAGLTGVGLDALVQRDAQRQIRRVTAITLGAVAAMLTMALLLVLALNARREAEHQRSEAEGLVEFMLTDLRTKLRGVGRLDVMSAVNERAIAYYGQQLGTLPDESLERRARVWHAMGEDDLTRGDFDGALMWLRQAHAATAAVLARHPGDAKAILTHAQSEYWLGKIHEIRAEWTEAKRLYQRYDAAARRLIAIDPNDPGYMLEMGDATADLGVVALRGAKDPAAAKQLFQSAIAWYDRAEQRRPGDVRMLTSRRNGEAWLSDSYYSLKRWPEALAARKRARAIAQRLYDGDRTNAERVYELALADRAVARLSISAGEKAAAPGLHASAVRRATWLAQHDPANNDWLLFKARLECEQILLPAMRPAGSDVGRLRRSVEAAAKTLKERGDRAAELARCLPRPPNPARPT